jgi:hypothetical protein
MPSSKPFHAHVDHLVIALLVVVFVVILVCLVRSKRILRSHQKPGSAAASHLKRGVLETFQVAPSPLPTTNHSTCIGQVSSTGGALANGPANIDYTMSNVDGVNLQPRAPVVSHPNGPGGVPRASDAPTATTTVFGNQAPLASPLMQGMDSACGPNCDMFVFQNNVASPECCPSTYSTSTGCVCTTPAQRELIRRRGVNS